LYTFFKDTLTVPKVKDLVNKPAKRYDEMYDSIRMQNSMVLQHQEQQRQQQQQQSTVQQSMQDELKNFLSELKKPNNANSNSNSNTNSNKNDNFPTANDMTAGYSPF